MTEILRRAGYQVLATGEPEKAFEIVRHTMPDLVITNVFLKGITGHQAIERLRSEFPGIRLLMVSGLPDDEIIRKWTNTDGFDAFPKPFTAEDLKRKVREVLA